MTLTTKQENKELVNMAHETRHLYAIGEIPREEALERVEPYIKKFNQKSREIAKKYGLRAKTISAKKFLRM